MSERVAKGASLAGLLHAVVGPLTAGAEARRGEAGREAQVTLATLRVLALAAIRARRSLPWDLADAGVFADESVARAVADLCPALFPSHHAVAALQRPGSPCREALDVALGAAPALLRDPFALGDALEILRRPRGQRAYRDALGEATTKIDGRSVVDVTSLYTPPALARLLASLALAPLQPPAASATARRPLRLLDPACGAGHLLIAALDLLAELGSPRAAAAPRLSARELAACLHGMDLDDLALAVADTALRLRLRELRPQDESPSPRLLSLNARLDDPDGVRDGFDAGADRELRAWVDAFTRDLGELDMLGALASPWRVRSGSSRAIERPSDEAVARALSQISRASWSGPAAGSLDVGQLARWLTEPWDVIVANPPFLSNRQMGEPLKRLVKRRFPAVSGDLYGCFLQRIEELLRPGGAGAVLCPEGWTTLASFARFRQGWLARNTVNAVISLGQRTFPRAPLVYAGVVAWTAGAPEPRSTYLAARVEPSRVERVTSLDTLRVGSDAFERVAQREIRALAGAPLLVGVPTALLSLLAMPPATIGARADVVAGIDTGDNARWVREPWEVPPRLRSRFRPYSKGKGFARWASTEGAWLDWGRDGQRLRAHPGSTIRNERCFFADGLECSYVYGGKVSCRPVRGAILDHGSLGIFPSSDADRDAILALLDSRLGSALARWLSTSLNLQVGCVKRLPLPDTHGAHTAERSRLVEAALTLASAAAILRAPADRGDDAFAGEPRVEARAGAALDDPLRTARLASLLDAARLVVEGRLEEWHAEAFALDASAREAIERAVGAPSASGDRLEGLDRFPTPPRAPEVTGEVSRAIARARRLHDADSRQQAPRRCGDDDRARVIAAFQNGGGARGLRVERRAELPPTSALERAARAIDAHPISAWNLIWGDASALERLEAAAGREAAVAWASCLVIAHLRRAGAAFLLVDELLDALRARRACSAEHARRAAAFAKWTGLPLEEWVAQRFFGEHLRRFRRRPVLWHVAGTEAQRGALLDAHQASAATLRALRERLREDGDAARRLTEVIRRGYDYDELRARLAEEPLDRWCATTPKGEAPPTIADFHDAERAYEPDLGAGVRLAIAPLQRAGLLAADVLAPGDDVAAIEDRARWRADERRWCREKKISAPSWWTWSG